MSTSRRLRWEGARHGGAGGMAQDPRWSAARRIAEALDPTTAPGRVRTLADMTPEERAKMLALYEKPAKK